MRATAIIPVKRFGAAKQRLLSTLDPPGRAILAQGMLTDVLAAASTAELIERVIMVTGEPRAERIAIRRTPPAAVPLEVLRDPRDAGHSEAATLGIVRAMALGASCVVLLPGDCPLLDPGELDAALGRMGSGRVGVVPDRHRTGTNALLLAPPNAIAPAFGPGSCARHADRARRAGYEVAVEPVDSLGLDIDTPDDLAALAEALEGAPDRAPATAAELGRLGSIRGGAPA
jgi:2-phospho-L-lactate/phosphoenolpyruvate guanylyltransferase